MYVRRAPRCRSSDTPQAFLSVPNIFYMYCVNLCKHCNQQSKLQCDFNILQSNHSSRVLEAFQFELSWPLSLPSSPRSKFSLILYPYCCFS
ncbi:hypothetical protein F5Y11DRAFT_310401 [Daldinia sp. FL1419]|nr:hypothetical protein F5Y11DRAFT_310401 [Daldinia sp. FL1419]